MQIFPSFGWWLYHFLSKKLVPIYTLTSSLWAHLSLHTCQYHVLQFKHTLKMWWVINGILLPSHEFLGLQGKLNIFLLFISFVYFSVICSVSCPLSVEVLIVFLSTFPIITMSVTFPRLLSILVVFVLFVVANVVYIFIYFYISYIWFILAFPSLTSSFPSRDSISTLLSSKFPLVVFVCSTF